MLWPASLRTHCDGDKDGSEKRCPLLPPAIESSHWSHLMLASHGLDMNPGLLLKQEKMFGRDWSIVKRVFPGANKDTFLYYWLVVNTRTFYYELPGLSGKRAKEDCMVMCPFIDYFNHADHGVSQARCMS